MAEPTRQQLMDMIGRIRGECDRLEAMINELKPEKKWLSTREFAKESGLTLKTISTYCGQGKFEKVRKNGKGQWEIHKSELNHE